MTRSTIVRRTTVLVSVLAVIGAVLYFGPFFGNSERHATAYFTQTKGLYTGDEVKILGVQVGTVDSIDASGTRVKVTFNYANDQRLPADVKAAIVAPSLVTGRFIQLAPAYTSGPQLANAATVQHGELQAVPVEFDQVKQELTALASALGPTPGNRKGVLNQLIATAAANLGGGTAQQLRDSIIALSKSASTLSANKDDLFATVANLSSFIDNLVRSQAAIQNLSGQLSGFSGVLAENSSNLKQLAKILGPTLDDLSSFVKNNRSTVTTSVNRLSKLATTLSTEKYVLADIVHQVPTAAANFNNIVDPRVGAVTGRPAVANFTNVADLACGLLNGLGQSANVVQTVCSKALGSLVGALHLPSSALLPLGLNPPTAGGSPAATAVPSGPGNLLNVVTGTLNGTVSTVNQTVTGLLGSLGGSK